MKYANIRRVLIADDDFDARALLEIFMRERGLEVTVARDGLQASEFLERQKFDLLITDFNMPHMDGMELLDWCRERGIHFPVIFLSAISDRAPREKIALEDCCATLMLKPVKFDIVETALQAADARVHHEACVHRRDKPV